ALLVREVAVEPAALSLNLVGHVPVRPEIVVTDLRPRPFTLTRVATSSLKLRAEADEARQDAQGHRVYRVRLDVAESLPEGKTEATVALYTDDSEYAELRVPVTLMKRGRQTVSATPAEANL